MTPFSTHKIKLGEYLVLPAHNKLLLNERELKLEPKIMQVLCYLMVHKDQVVSRQQIAEGLWPGTVAGLDVVTRAIFELRKILNDDAKNPQFIETISRKGYSFIHSFEVLDSIIDSPIITLPRMTNYKTRIYLVGLFVLLLVLLALLVILQPTIQQEKDYQTSLLTDFTIYANMHAVSPDWDRVIFVKNNSTTDSLNQLVLLDLKNQKQNLVTEKNAHFRSPVWGSDSQNWFYVRCSEERCDVIKHRIKDNHQQTIFSSEQYIRSLALSPDQSQITLAIRRNGLLSIATLNLTASNIALDYIIAPDSQNDLPVYDPTGLFIYFISQIPGNAAHLYQYDLSNKSYKPLIISLDTIWGISIKSADELWIAGRREGDSAIWKLNLVSETLDKIIDTGPEELLADISVSSDGGNVIYESRTRDINLAQVGLDDRLNLQPTNSAMIDMKALFSVKRDTSYFVSNRSGVYEIWNYHAGQTERLTQLNANMIERPILSKQQDQLAFVTRLNATKQIIIYDLDSNKILNKIQLQDSAFLLNWSHRKDIVYFASVEDGEDNIYELNILSGKKNKILLNASIFAQESDDGKLLYYIDITTWQLMAKDQNGEVTSILKLNYSDGKPQPHQVNIIDNQFFYISKQNSQNSLKSYSFENKTTSVHINLPPDAYVTQIGVLDQPFIIYDFKVAEHSKLIYLRK